MDAIRREVTLTAPLRKATALREMASAFHPFADPNEAPFYRLNVYGTPWAGRVVEVTFDERRDRLTVRFREVLAEDVAAMTGQA